MNPVQEIYKPYLTLLWDVCLLLVETEMFTIGLSQLIIVSNSAIIVTLVVIYH